MKYPENFDESTFDIWYKEQFGEPISLDEQITQQRTNLADYFFNYDINNTKEKNKNLWFKFLQLIEASLEHTVISRSVKMLDYQPKGVINKNEFTKQFIKPAKSIKEKLWRLNKKLSKGEESNFISIKAADILMKDMVRFSIKTESLKIAEEFANDISKILMISNNQFIKSFCDDYIESIVVDTELKMYSGYFAYHAYFKFKSGHIVELQIFSELSNNWRILSHKLYEKIRLIGVKEYKFNDINTRIVAIGNLLYLADCELYNIEKELGLK